jgi:hypothetical protein
MRLLVGISFRGSTTYQHLSPAAELNEVESSVKTKANFSQQKGKEFSTLITPTKSNQKFNRD